MGDFLDFISNFIEITGDSVADSIILAVIGVVAFLVAFGIVGMIFDALGIYDSDLMSGAHWTIRIIVFLGLSFVCILMAKFIKWLFSFQWWIYLIAGLLLVGTIILTFVIRHKLMKKKAEQAKKENDNRTIEAKSIDKDHCPRCGGLLVKRHGPYGDFYGCENYSRSNCRYTRKFK
ncbi:MAG: topoisomerase DNA-binding C4 zinc finger domain-containing protein [Bacilli bacterium]|nr:topoisomerase DNA-binding C4 zinc finger domain-containing protein [Bacilli bacterium]